MSLCISIEICFAPEREIMAETSTIAAETEAVLPEEVEATVQQLLKLPSNQRLAISRRLESSVGVDSKWARVAASRAEELRTGKAQGVSIDEAFEQARRAVDAIRPNAS
jgi:hypothetical protein